MTINKKAVPAGTGTASRTTSPARNFTAVRPIVTGQMAEVLEVIRRQQPVPSFELTANLAIPEADRPLFHAAIAHVRDTLPCVRPIWRTINERHIDGVRTRQQMFRICPRQSGVVDSTLAGSITFLAVCIMLLAGWFA